jgi:hypothetical protein
MREYTSLLAADVASLVVGLGLATGSNAQTSAPSSMSDEAGIVTLTVLIHGKALETALVTPLQRWQRSIPPSPRAGRGGELAG